MVRKEARDRGRAITAPQVEAAKEALILERRSHIDSLIARLREPRIAKILGPMRSATGPGPWNAHDLAGIMAQLIAP